MPLAAAGLVLGGDVVATEAVPPFANTAMDGYAVRAADTAGAPVVLRSSPRWRPGTGGACSAPARAVRIFTGAAPRAPTPSSPSSGPSG